MAMFVMALAATATEQLPAFPGAEGFGRYVTGGRGGKILHVTKLDDSGYQSLRWCLQQQGAKIIVFDVSGTIHLQSALSIPSNTTIAGQSAPGDGICVADYPVSISGNNVIVRYMRFRLGNKNVLKDGADGWDGFGGFDKQDWIIDHCSVSWSTDECLSVLGNKNTTVQWCLVAQSIVNSGHSKGAHGYGGNWGGSGASFHHNLIAHHTSRTPRLGPRPTTQLDERMDMRNNVIYNFGGNGCYGGEGMTVNIVNNYYKPGPGSPTGDKGKRIAGIGIRTNDYIKTYPAYAPALHLWGKYYVTLYEGLLYLLFEFPMHDRQGEEIGSFKVFCLDNKGNEVVLEERTYASSTAKDPEKEKTEFEEALKKYKSERATLLAGIWEGELLVNRKPSNW